VNPAVAQHTLLTKASVLFVHSSWRKPERFQATHGEVNVFPKPCLPHCSTQACPVSILTVPCRGIRSSRSNKPTELRWYQFPREAGLASHASTGWLAAGTEFTTAPPKPVQGSGHRHHLVRAWGRLSSPSRHPPQWAHRMTPPVVGNA